MATNLEIHNLSIFLGWAGERRRLALIAECARDEMEANQTLQAIDEGTFGDCVGCDDPIDRELLRSRPWATRCPSCQAVPNLVPFEQPAAARAAAA